jgi:penicillin-binding protein 1B
MLLLAAGLGYLWYLNQLIERRFDQGAWAKPSRVYARPLELYTGLALTAQQLERELRLADYRKVATLDAPGQFKRDGERIDLFSRAFRFPDEQQPAMRIAIQFGRTEIGSITDLDTRHPVEAFRLTPALIGSFLPGNGEDRLVVDDNEVPERLKQILLAVEDRQFEQHFGINPASIIRALWQNLQAGKIVQGGSTLTQQLAKNLFLTPRKSLLRKFNEALLALLLEARYDKPALLAAYVNEVFLLQHNNSSVHGFALASRFLFKKSLDELGIDEMALLVGMVRGPSIYNPLKHPERARERRNQILQILLETGQINPAQRKWLAHEPLGVVDRLPAVNPYPAYLDLVKKQLPSAYSAADLERKGLNIFTAFNPSRQHQLELGLANGLKRFADSSVQPAAIVADYLSGDVVAMVSDRQPTFPGFNRAISAQRPIGSLIKPLLLYGLVESGQTLASLVDDRPIRIRQSDGAVWSPRNFDRKLHGRTTLYNAFINSYNLPFVRLGVDQGGLEPLVANLQRIHLLKQSTVYPSLLLGSTAMTAFEVAQMYQVIANAGYFAALTTIREVVDTRGEVLTRIPLESRELFKRNSMLQVIRGLIGVTTDGTARYLQQRFAGTTYAGKTGTTNDLRDSWFAGFGNRHLSVVWLGKDDNQPVGLTGSAGALRVWADIMAQIGEASLQLAPAPALEWHYIDRLDGGLSKQGCENSVLLPFARGSAPTERAACRGNYLQRGLEWLQEEF